MSPPTGQIPISSSYMEEGSLVYCVTGGTGFIASHLIKSLLAAGHSVRATVRQPGEKEKVKFLEEMRGAENRLRLVKSDLMEEGSFDKAVDGVDGVFHTACPVVVAYDGDLQSTLIDPCVEGTMNVLRSCVKSGTVRRVVLTSSCSTVRYLDDDSQLRSLDHSHWSDPDYCKRNNLWYAYAKTMAERKAWDFAREVGINLLVVNPSFVIGPLLSPHPTSTILLLLALIKGTRGEYSNQRIGFIHIDDVVAAHILAMENKEASGRLICSGPVLHWSDIIIMLKSMYPQYPYEQVCNKHEGDDRPHDFDMTKITKLGLPPLKTLHSMFDDCIRSFQQSHLL